MDSSSDESFVWTKASTGSDDSEMDATNDYESQNDIKQEELDSSKKSQKELKTKKRKHTSNSKDSTDVESPKKKKIKVEPHSDNEFVRKKKTPLNETFNEKEDFYINNLVKEEREYQEKTKKSKNHKDVIINGEDSYGEPKYKEDTNENRLDSPKNKRKNTSEKGESFFNAEDSYREHDTNKTKINSSKKKRKISGPNKQNETEDSIAFVDSNVKNVGSQDYGSRNLDDCIDNDPLNTPKTRVSNNSPTLKISSQRVPRMSDKIKFEDEIDSDAHLDSHISINNNFVTTSSNIKKFLKDNSKLKANAKCPNTDLEITDDDEIWVLKCPHDVNIDNLKDSNFNLDSKSKIKINGESYCGNLDDNIKINIMSASKNGFKITHFVPKGIIHFRKRLPKPHFHEDNIMANNQTDFIPLPETKCRHPLFGSNYKDYINIPIEQVKLSSRHFNTSFSNADKKKKKKHKKEQHNETELQPKTEYDLELSLSRIPKVEVETDVPLKKAKKRKRHNDEHSNKKKKKRKLENSTDAWDSEKAIEENLFNF